MPASALSREAERLAYLLHRLKYPDAPPLLLTDSPEDLELVSVARDLRRVLPKIIVADVIADLESLLAYFDEHGTLPRRCAHCQQGVAESGAHFCSAACRTAYYRSAAEPALPIA
ncbi:MAG TPA: hypothetical protein VFD32_07180 [Dehalococcoidia bacterium]|nr:hypothetical protein [Dehalococcoidia bacterium]